MSAQHVIRFDEISIDDVSQVGGKNASLGEMIRHLASKGIRVPGGFATTASAFRGFVSGGGIEPRMRHVLEQFHRSEVSVQQAGEGIRRLLLDTPMPGDIAEAIRSAYRELCDREGVEDLPVAVRSSATAEDLPEASFAGAQETYLNISGEDAVLKACLDCFASLFTDRAISYREAKGFDHLEVALSVGVQRMVRSDTGGAGVMFSIDTDTGFPDAVVISAAWGLGETVVKGLVDPDRYVVFKPLLSDPALVPIVEMTRGAKRQKLVHGESGDTRTQMVETTAEERESFVLGEAEILDLARWGVIVENHYGRPMDMEWAKDGVSGELFLVQARPETVQAVASGTRFTMHRLVGEGEVLVTGAAVGTSIVTGEACIVRDTADIEKFRDGAILVAEMTDPDWVSVMARSAGIVTDHGGSTSHAAIVSRELGIPAIVGTTSSTSTIVDGQTITVSCAGGDVGTVYDGALAFVAEEIDLGDLPRTRTALMVNIASPAAAVKWWRLPTDGVGLARMEFIINDLIRVHPMALAHPDRVTDVEQRRQIDELTKAYSDPKEYFVDILSRGIAKLAAPYYPAPVIVRLSDFKTNEYAHLLGGRFFEGEEENPMLGFRGASRYYDERYRDGFALECQALKRVRERMGFSNVIVMVPFCRTVAEADRVLETLAANGLTRGENGLQLYMMCEIPSNVVLAEQFAARFDGFSIGSNDLTQLVLGVDRDSADLAALFDERDEAVKAMISDAIRKAHAAGIKVGICGQGPSNHPDFAEFLVREGIDSISLNPDSFLGTVRVIAECESRLA